MCGRCTRSAAGISSPLEIASANSMKTSLDRADTSSLPLFIISWLLQSFIQLQQHTVSPPMFQTGLKRGKTTFVCKTSPNHIRCTLDTIGTAPVLEGMTCNLPGHFVSLVLGLVFDSVLPFTPHNPKSLHNFFGGGGFFLRNTGLCGVMGQCVSHIMHQNPTSIF